MNSHFVAHTPCWVPARLRYNAAGDTKPGYICNHPLENGRGICGGSVWEVEDAIGDHGCIVLDPDYCPVHQHYKWCGHNRGCDCRRDGWHAPHEPGWDGESDFYEEDQVHLTWIYEWRSVHGQVNDQPMSRLTGSGEAGRP